MAVMNRAAEEVVRLAACELARAERWQDGVRSALAATLTYFDGQPGLARVCFVEVLAGGPTVLKHRERIIAMLRVLVVERIEEERSTVWPLAAQGAMSCVFGIVHAHIVNEEPGPLIELLGPLMALVAAPCNGARGMKQEIEQGAALAREILDGACRLTVAARERDGEADPDAFSLPRARRARECLLFLAEHPRSSNREVGVAINIPQQSQVSKLLAYLLAEGLATKRSMGPGKRNAWWVTQRGEEIVRAMLAR
ncbi:MAG TPA: hypothetical protein VMD79_11025 [Solirubrobacteraceae bacterium]|nr:hypothetical protein [Solirubrobacteraceae bacterium]